MRAAVLRSVPGQLEIEEVSIDLPQPGEVLVRVSASGLCHTDLHFMQGHLPVDVPAILGHEVAGIVEKVGDGVTYVKPGDHVIACLSVFCGQCQQCLTGHPSICAEPESTDRSQSQPSRLQSNNEDVVQFMRIGGFAEQILVHQNAIAKIRKDMPLDKAALIGCGVTTGLGAVFNTAKVKPGATVAVIGCGAIGLNVIQGAKICGASRIIAIDTNPRKLETASKFGATDFINPADGDPVEQVLELTKGTGVNFSFEAIGNSVTARQAFMMLAKGASAIIIGLMGSEEEVSLPGLHFLAERKIQGCDMGSNRFRIDMPQYVEFYMDGRLNLDDMISERITLDEINDGFTAMSQGDTVRSVIMFDD
jgi:S-(hydroxymethyl)glutathione dehydrogenase / alcohol dehydrogenase